MAATFKTAMAKLQQMRTQQIEALNETRDDMKALTKDWVTLLEGEVSKMRDKFAETQLEIEEKEKTVTEAVTNCETAKTKWNDERGILEKESDWLNDVMCKWRRHSEQAAMEIERRTTDVDEESNEDLRRITNHRKILDELAFAEHVELTEEELEDKQQAFDKYKKLKEGEWVCYTVVKTVCCVVVESLLLIDF
ncbi:hypothetical protein NP493_430g01008 [Ridgeia piscesae]|uniref:Uncharacterized protein n=1 Tax=Ridgeia piscesae TaxID=27915 RepID=A0AAD9L0C8_RIDPI|nr:hypothetical protein NP493_430g01008 [Ridgeia piscesae]